MAFTNFAGFQRNASAIKSKPLALIVCLSSVFAKNRPSAASGATAIELDTKDGENGSEYYFLGYTEQDSLQSTLEVGDTFSTGSGPKMTENYNVSIEGTGLGNLSLIDLKELAENVLTVLAVDSAELENLTGYLETSKGLEGLGEASTAPDSPNLTAHWIIDKVGFTGGYNVAAGKADRVPLKFEREKVASYTDGIYESVGYEIYDSSAS